MMRHILLFSLALAGCDRKGGRSDSGALDTGEPADVLAELVIVHDAPWDPIVMRMASAGIVQPQVEDAEGRLVEMEPLQLHGETYAWRAAGGGFDPGDYRIVGPYPAALGDPVPFSVQPWGRGEAFSPDDVVGAVYEIDILGEGQLDVPAGLLGYLFSQLGAAWLEVLDVSEDTMEFRIVVPTDGDPDNPCVVLRAVGALSDQGEGIWTLDEIEASTEPVPLQLWDLSARFGWGVGGGTGAGVEAGLSLDTRPLVVAIEEDGGDDYVCDLAAGFGAECRACESDGALVCADLRTHGRTMALSDRSFDEELPYCGGDLRSGSGSFSCDWEPGDWSCAGTLLFPGLLGFGAVLRGRRKR